MAFPASSSPQFSSFTPNDNVPPLPTSLNMSTDTRAYREPVSKDDELWKIYVDKAAEFDERIIEDWNKIVDVTLVFVGILY